MDIGGIVGLASGWLVDDAMGFHDFGAAACIHMIAGFFALGVVINLGPRIGRFDASGEPVDTKGHSVPLADRYITRKFEIDDAVGAFSVHGVAGVIGVVGLGIFSGFPNVAGPEISFFGQVVSAAVMAALGFIPGYVVSLLMAKANVLRVPPKAEAAGLDLVEVPLTAYPEAVPATLNSKEIPTLSTNSLPQGASA